MGKINTEKAVLLIRGAAVGGLFTGIFLGMAIILFIDGTWGFGLFNLFIVILLLPGLYRMTGYATDDD